MSRAYLVRWPNVISAAGASEWLKCHPPGAADCDGGERDVGYDGSLLADDSGSGWAEAGVDAAAAAGGGYYRTQAFRTSLPVPGATFVT